MPLGITWYQYLKYWAAGIGGLVCGSQWVHNFYKPLGGIENLIEAEYQKLRENELSQPLEENVALIEKRVAHFDSLHKEWQEHEKAKPKLELPAWLSGKK